MSPLYIIPYIAKLTRDAIKISNSMEFKGDRGETSAECSKVNFQGSGSGQVFVNLCKAKAT